MRGRRYVLFNILKIGRADVTSVSVRHPPLFPMLTNCTLLRRITYLLRNALCLRNDLISFHHLTSANLYIFLLAHCKSPCISTPGLKRETECYYEVKYSLCIAYHELRIEITCTVLVYSIYKFNNFPKE